MKGGDHQDRCGGSRVQSAYKGGHHLYRHHHTNPQHHDQHHRGPHSVRSYHHVIMIQIHNIICLFKVLDQSVGKFVPYIFMEWANLRLNR